MTDTIISFRMRDVLNWAFIYIPAGVFWLAVVKMALRKKQGVINDPNDAGGV